MQRQQQYRPSNGTKAIALNEQKLLARYRLLQFIALVLSATFALSLHIIFGQ